MNRGFSTIEVLLSSSILILIVTAFMGAYIYGSESTALAGQRARAAFLAEEGLEASRNIRDENFSNLTNGTFGLATTGNQWNLSGSSDITDIFTRAITISTIDANRKQVTSAVTWQQNPQRTGSVSLTSYLTNWKAGVSPPATCNDYAISQGYIAGTCRQNANQCTNNGETYLATGDALCTGGPSADTCCGQPTAPTTCAGYCQSLNYSNGTCRKGVPQCNANGETNEHGGNSLCQQAEGGTCCCLP